VSLQNAAKKQAANLEEARLNSGNRCATVTGSNKSEYFRREACVGPERFPFTLPLPAQSVKRITFVCEQRLLAATEPEFVTDSQRVPLISGLTSEGRRCGHWGSELGR
jgi:hypothetical protein